MTTTQTTSPTEVGNCWYAIVGGDGVARVYPFDIPGAGGRCHASKEAAQRTCDRWNNTLSVHAYVDASGKLCVQAFGNPGLPGYEPGEDYVGSFSFRGIEPQRLHWGYWVVPRDVYGSVLDRIRKSIRRGLAGDRYPYHTRTVLPRRVVERLQAAGEI